MKRTDIHIHHRQSAVNGAVLLGKLNEADIARGVVLSESPIAGLDRPLKPAQERIDNVMAFVQDCDALVPFFFIDPTEPDALAQVDRALAAGVQGFKTICNHFHPGDERAVPVYHRVAESGKPYLFHCGILYDGANASGQYNRPCGFEVLLSVPKLRFALAHIGWPWCDECIAVYGKFSNYLERHGSADAPEMFIDLTPGTPPVYRRDALTKLLSMPDIRRHLLWGTDNSTDHYDPGYAQQIISRDAQIFEDLGLGAALEAEIHEENAARFFGA